jgi:alpha-tubulin suppressor-like RCC1 family protein
MYPRLAISAVIVLLVALAIGDTDPAFRTGRAHASSRLVSDATHSDATLTPRVPLVAVELAAGEGHTCARFNDGTVKCWGNNNNGQLGLGGTNNRGDGPGEMGAALPTVPLGIGRTALRQAAGREHTCATLDNGAVKCWGRNFEGQLGLADALNRGDGPGEMGDNLLAVDLGAGRTVTQLTAGSQYTCAVLDNGDAKCWGDNDAGQLGLEDSIPRGGQAGEMGDALPVVNLGGGPKAVELSAGSRNTCARRADGSAKCWGSNTVGELGLGKTGTEGNEPGEMGDVLPALNLGLGRHAVELRASTTYACVRLDNGAVKCWGYNFDGQLGLGDTDSRGDEPGEVGDALASVDLGTGVAVVQLTTGGRHACARFANGTVKCWGRNTHGQLLLGDIDNRGDQPGEMGVALSPVNLGTGRTAVEVAAGANHTCAILDNGVVKCWGQNIFGQLGLGDKAHRGDGPGETGDNLPPIDVGTGTPTADPCQGLTPNITLANVGANGYVYCGATNGLTAFEGRAPGVVPDSVTAIFWWSNPDQQFRFWFRGFPNNFQTLTSLEAGKYYFFQVTTTGGTIANTGGNAPLAASGAASISTVAGANGHIWSGGPHAANSLSAYVSIMPVTAIFSWNNAAQQFNFWFRGFPGNFQTLTAGIERGQYYFFQTPAGQTISMD